MKGCAERLGGWRGTSVPQGKREKSGSDAANEPAVTLIFITHVSLELLHAESHIYDRL